MGFRLTHPGLSEERCRGCKMLGGVTIQTEAQARAYTSAMRAHPEAWSPRDLDPSPVRPGETLDLEPCVGAGYEALYGRECPRVELWPENAPAARLVFASLPEHTRHLLPSYIDALTLEMSAEEARSVVLRAVETLHSEAVTGWMRAQVSPPEESDDH